MAQETRQIRMRTAFQKVISLFQFRKFKLETDEGCIKLTRKQLNKRFLNAATEGRTKEIRKMLKIGANVKARDKDGFTSLMHALWCMHIDTCRLLIRNGADVNETDKKGEMTTLMHAANNGYKKICIFLIEMGADPNAKSRNGFTALMLAAKGGYIATCALLLKNGADINAINYAGDTALKLAKSNNKFKTETFLWLFIHPEFAGLGRKELQIRRKRLNDDFLSAAARGDNAEVTRLLDAGADIDAKNGIGGTALIHAICVPYAGILSDSQADKIIAKLLIERGANVNATDDKGLTALYYAAATRPSFNLDPLYYAAGNFTFLNSSGIYESVSIYALLIKHGANEKIWLPKGFNENLPFAFPKIRPGEMLNIRNIAYLRYNMEKEARKLKGGLRSGLRPPFFNSRAEPYDGSQE
jgi:ankyrin repeat protein